MSTILDQIVASKRLEIEAAQDQVPATELERRLAGAPPVRDFRGAMDEVEHAAPRRDVVPEDVVLGRRLGAEDAAERVVDEQALAARAVDREVVMETVGDRARFVGELRPQKRSHHGIPTRRARVESPGTSSERFGSSG